MLRIHLQQIVPNRIDVKGEKVDDGKAILKRDFWKKKILDGW